MTCILLIHYKAFFQNPVILISKSAVLRNHFKVKWTTDLQKKCWSKIWVEVTITCLLASWCLCIMSCLLWIINAFSRGCYQFTDWKTSLLNNYSKYLSRVAIADICMRIFRVKKNDSSRVPVKYSNILLYNVNKNACLKLFIYSILIWITQALKVEINLV